MAGYAPFLLIEDRMAKTPWKKAVMKVLEQADGAMDYKDIADKIVSKKIKKKVGANPRVSVNNAIRLSLKNEGDKSPFEWVGTGLYRLRPDSDVPIVTPSDNEPVDSTVNKNNDDDNEITDTSIVHAFGMYWQREKVNWKPKPKLYGAQQAGTLKVDFSTQQGIYLLHDNIEVIYVGRSINRPLGTRLYEHTKDRLNGRWNRFSWFGLKNVSEEGVLEDLNIAPSVATIITTLEALLIEGLEPRQNRRRGDELKEYEYLQEDDPSIKRQRKKDIIEEMLKSIDKTK